MWLWVSDTVKLKDPTEGGRDYAVYQEGTVC